MSASTPIHLDGTTLEGGGQLLRLALSLSSLTHIPVHITDIRGNRGSRSAPGSAGGLKPAHLAGAKWLAEATAANTEGLEVKSKELTFRPMGTEEDRSLNTSLRPRHAGASVNDKVGVWTNVYEDDRLIRRDSQIPVSTPGSISLVLQAILPYLIFGPAAHISSAPVPLRITIQGGTNVTNSPSIEYVSQVLLPSLSWRLGIPSVNMNIHKRGWSHGSSQVGKVTFDVQPLQLGSVLSASVFHDRGSPRKFYVSILAPDPQIRNSIRDQVIAQLLAYEPNVEILFPVDENSRHEKRFYLLVVAETSNGYLLGRDWLYDRKTKGVGPDETCKNLVSKVIGDLKRELKHGGCVDEFMQDQLVIFQALAAGKTTVECGKQHVSLHTETARWVVKQILGIGFDNMGHCEGLGFKLRGLPGQT